MFLVICFFLKINTSGSCHTELVHIPAKEDFFPRLDLTNEHVYLRFREVPLLTPLSFHVTPQGPSEHMAHLHMYESFKYVWLGHIWLCPGVSEVGNEVCSHLHVPWARCDLSRGIACSRVYAVFDRSEKRVYILVVRTFCIFVVNEI